jgi:hypothetical protein
MKYPRSGYDKVGGIYYFARMLDKIRLHARGELPSDYHANLGKGMDGRCTRYLHVDYGALSERVKAGATDEEAFAWCQTAGRKLSEDEPSRGTLSFQSVVGKMKPARRFKKLKNATASANAKTSKPFSNTSRWMKSGSRRITLLFQSWTSSGASQYLCNG